MKKLGLKVLIFLLVILFVGCSSSVETQKSEEELKEELRDEIKAELIAKAKAEEEKESNKIFKLSINDSDKLFEFISLKYPKYTREDYDKWTVDFFDVTGDGEDEVIMSSTYGDGKLYNAIVITLEENKYREISKYIDLAKYGNEFEMQDGFFVHKSKSGGSGIHELYMNLYSYNGEFLQPIKTGIMLEEGIAGPSVQYDITTVIEGNLDDFTITYTKENYIKETNEIIMKDKYKYTGDYKMTKMPISLSNTAKQFSSVYKDNLYETISYFNENLYSFGEEERKDFARKIFDKLKEEEEKFSQSGEFFDIPNEYYNKETMEYDVTNLNDEFVKAKLLSLKENYIYTLAKSFYATEGEIQDNSFTLILDSWVMYMLEPVFEILEIDDSKLQFKSPDIYFDSEYMSSDIVTNTHYVYPSVFVSDYNSLNALKGKDTWKTNVFMGLEIIGEVAEIEEPKAEEPKAEEPKAEEPKAEEPKAEEPKAEEPKAEEPKVEEPKTEETEEIVPGTFEEISPASDDYSKGYSYEIRDKKIYVNYYNTNSEKMIVKEGNYNLKFKNNQTYSDYKITGIKNIKHSLDKSKLFFLGDKNELLAYNFLDNEIHINWIKDDGKTANVKDYQPIYEGNYKGNYKVLTMNNNAKLYDENFNEIMDIESIYSNNIVEVKKEKIENIAGYEAELVDGINIDYADYVSVVIPEYSGKYKDLLERKNVSIGAIEETPVYKPGQVHQMVMGPQKVYKQKVNFAAFGKIDNIKIVYNDYSNSKVEEYKIESLTDNLVTIYTNFTNDMTSIKVSFSTKLLGDKLQWNEIVLDDMRSSYEPILTSN